MTSGIATPDSQYITLISTANKSSFPNNTSSNFTTRFDPPLELRGGDFNIALLDIFHPTKWVNINPDKYYIVFEKKEKVRHLDPTFIDPRTYYPNPTDEPQEDAPSTETREDSSWTSWFIGEDADEKEHWSELNKQVNARREAEASRRQTDDAPQPETARLEQPKELSKKERERQRDRDRRGERRVEDTKKDVEHRRETPKLNNTKWRTLAVQKLRIPQAYYPSLASVLQIIKENMKEEFKDNEFDVFSIDTTKNKVRLRLNPGIYIRLSRRLAKYLGFQKREHQGGIDKLADFEPEMKKHLGSLHVYITAMRERVVGDTMAPLIAMVPHVDNFSPGLKIAHHTFLRPNYFPVSQKYFDTVTVNIRDDSGELVPFIEGSTTLTLHLVRASP